MSDYEYEKYLSDIDNLKSTLEKYGLLFLLFSMNKNAKILFLEYGIF
jgi:hypothetical protein